MRDDLFCFTFMGHRVCVMLHDRAALGWSYTIDGGSQPPAPKNVSYAQRVLLQEAGMVARDCIRMMRLDRNAPAIPELLGDASSVAAAPGVLP